MESPICGVTLFDISPLICLCNYNVLPPFVTIYALLSESRNSCAACAKATQMYVRLSATRISRMYMPVCARNAAKPRNCLKLEMLSCLLFQQLRCYRRRGAQSFLRPCVGRVASVTQEKYFCAGRARGDAKISTDAKIFASHRRNSDAKIEYTCVCGVVFWRMPCVVAGRFRCAACVTCAGGIETSSPRLTLSKDAGVYSARSLAIHGRRRRLRRPCAIAAPRRRSSADPF